MKKMTIFGIGHKLFAATVLYTLFALIITLKYTWIFKIAVYDSAFLKIPGIILMVIGLLFYISSVMVFLDKYKENILIKSGTYSICRNPLYASWIVFFIPAFSLIMNSWIIASSALFMYVLMRIMICEEERFLEEKFGDEYREYRESVNLVFPVQKWGEPK